MILSGCWIGDWDTVLCLTQRNVFGQPTIFNLTPRFTTPLHTVFVDKNKAASLAPLLHLYKLTPWTTDKVMPGERTAKPLTLNVFSVWAFALIQHVGMNTQYMQQVLLHTFIADLLFMDIHDVGPSAYLGKIVTDSLG